MTEQESVSDALAEEAAELIQETNAQYEERRREQEEFLETVAEEEGAEVLETQCNLMGDYTVTLEAKLDGDLMDRMGHMDARVERFENGEARGYEISETADEISQLLADVISDEGWPKSLFYDAYRDNGLEPLGVMLERVFEALEEERDRRSGAADGFRQK